MNERQREGITFAELALGVQVVDGPPPAGSRLARLHEMDAEAERTGMSDEDFACRAAGL